MRTAGMMPMVTMAWAAAAGIAMCSAVLGVCLARIVWADDLQQARKLSEMWDKSRSAMERTMETQQRTIEIQRSTIERLQARSTAP